MMSSLDPLHQVSTKGSKHLLILAEMEECGKEKIWKQLNCKKKLLEFFKRKLYN
jgi:hypothetical protein